MEKKMINIPEYKSAEAPFRFFAEISRIPRGSGNTAPIADYLVNFANARGLEVHRDAADNVVIKKPATPGLEGRPAVIFQGHTDIVAEKDEGVDIDMEKEGVRIYRDGDFLTAEGTTLGGDDGVALAYALAILDSKDIPHPDFEAVFTSDEEIGLLGATALDPSLIKGRLMINIDSDEEGIFTVGCAGGVRADISLPISREMLSGEYYAVSLSGLRGGHSGIEIDKGRTNAIKLLGELLSRLDGVRIVEISGGNADNAIPRDASAVIFSKGAITDEKARELSELVKMLAKDECDASLEISKISSSAAALTRESSEKVISLITSEPSGVIGMSGDIEGLVETSLNMGVVRLSETEFSLAFSLRSSVGAKKAALLQSVTEIASSHGASVSTRGDYPAWEYRRESHLRDVMCEVYEKMYGKAPKVVTIHAGLECGIFSDKLSGLDCVSIGPNNYDIHTPAERLSISSTARVWEYLLEVLKSI